MTASVSFYNNWKEASNDAALRSATIKLSLHSSLYTFLASHSVYADLTNELPTANGYTSGGQALAGVSWDQTGGTATFDATDTSWTASGGSLVLRRAVLRVVGTFNSQVDPLILSILLDNTPADVTTTPGNTLTFQWHASGIYSLT